MDAVGNALRDLKQHPDKMVLLNRAKYILLGTRFIGRDRAAVESSHAQRASTFSKERIDAFLLAD
jgi:hypothetical protein